MIHYVFMYGPELFNATSDLLKDPVKVWFMLSINFNISKVIILWQSFVFYPHTPYSLWQTEKLANLPDVVSELCNRYELPYYLEVPSHVPLADIQAYVCNLDWESLTKEFVMISGINNQQVVNTIYIKTSVH